MKNWKNQFNWTDQHWGIKCFACPLTFLSRHTENQPSVLETKISWLWNLFEFRNRFRTCFWIRNWKSHRNWSELRWDIYVFLFEWLSFQDMPKYQPTAQRKEISWLWSSSNHWWKCFRMKNWKNQFNWTDHYWLIKCFACPLTFLSNIYQKSTKRARNKNFLTLKPLQ